MGLEREIRKEIIEEIRKLKRDKISLLLLHCNTQQVSFFGDIFGSVLNIADLDLDGAIDLCARTVEENLKE